MYAVVKTGGKQYRVEKEDVLLVEKLSANDRAFCAPQLLTHDAPPSSPPTPCRS